MWEEWIKIGWEITDFSTYLKEKHLTYYSVAIIGEDYEWLHDESLGIDEQYYKCPLLDLMIWMGDCYDINQVLDRVTKPSILSGLEEEIGIMVDLNKAAKKCINCKHRMKEV